MKDEYIIINKTAIQKRIDELGEITLKTSNEDNRGFTQEVWNDLIDDSILSSEYKTLNQILSQSSPLIPEIEKGIKQGLSICLSKKDWAYGISGSVKQDIQDYISNLKLDI